MTRINRKTGLFPTRRPHKTRDAAYKREYMRRYRATFGRHPEPNKRERNKKWIAENPQKRQAQIIFQTALRVGWLIKLDRCESCKQPAPRIEGHHPDYSKPLEVIWLCPTCHRKADRQSNSNKETNQ